MATDGYALIITTFIAVVAFVLLVGLLVSGRRTVSATQRSLDSPLDDWSYSMQDANIRRAVMDRVSSLIRPQENTQAGRLKTRLLQAGFYERHSTGVFLTVKLLLMVGPMVLGVAFAMLGAFSVMVGVLLGAAAGLAGTIIPTLWLSVKKADRQKQVRRALPDALDVIVICMEGGLSLTAAIDRVVHELKYAHPLLSNEMAIVRGEVQLGRSNGEALRQLADRFDTEELRSLAGVVAQAERYGASLVKAMQVHADAMRLHRYQYAEAMAQKAPVKLVFPTVLCIFPALYIVLMGPAGVQFLQMIENL